MKKDKTFKVGDKIIHHGQVYRIFKIRGERNKDKVIFFRRYFKSKKNRKLVCSIPIDSINKTNIRRLVSKKNLRDLFKTLSRKPEAKTAINIIEAKEWLTLNSPDKNVEVLNRLWHEKKIDPDHFNKTKENVFKLAIEKLSEEVAFVSDVSLMKAGKKIKNALEKNKSVR